MNAALPAGLSMRPIEPDEFEAYHRATVRAFSSTPHTGDRDMEQRVFEFDRSLAVLDRGRPVASAAIYSLDMTLPGGSHPVAGVTWVAVLPTHRRQGLMTALMDRQLADLHEGGEPVAALWASEGSIYGRFGYGRASFHYGATIKRGEGALRPDSPDRSGTLRLEDDPNTVVDELTLVHERTRVERVGDFVRTPGRWFTRLYDPEHWRSGNLPLSAVLHDGPSGPDGYALYTSRSDDDPSQVVPGGRVIVRELVADTPTAAAALWRYLFGIDLIGEVVAHNLAVDDPLQHLLADPRLSRLQHKDGLWVRLIDVRRAMSIRTYEAPVDVVLGVTDSRCPWNAGRFRLSGDEDGATCLPTSDAADVSLDVRELGSAYLGGVALSELALGGLVTEHTKGALTAASRALRTDRPPWCSLVF